MNKTFGRILREARRQLKLSCRQLAEFTETTVGYIIDLEQDSINIPALSEIKTFEEVLKIIDGRLRAFYSPDSIYQNKDKFVSTTFLADGSSLQISTENMNPEFHEKLRRINIAINAIHTKRAAKETLLEAWETEGKNG